jgi:glycosyltransferase involved in cell wall biosynthesis
MTSAWRARPVDAQARASYHLRRRDLISHPACLQLLHANPFRADAGGTERHVLDLLALAKFPRALVIYPGPGAIVAAEVLGGDVREPLFHRYPVSSQLPQVSLECPEAAAILEEIVDCFRVRLAHIHHLFGWPVRAWRIFLDNGVPFFYSVHDFYCVCPNINLFDHSMAAPCACDLDEPRTKRCLRAFQKAAGIVLEGCDSEAVRRHRREFAAMLTRAAGIVFPSVRALELVQERYPALPIRSHVVPHGLDCSPSISHVAASGGPLRVGVLGSVGHPVKGADKYLEVVRRTREYQIEWHFFGDLSAFNYKSRLQEAGEATRLVFHGFYDRAEITGLLRRNRIDVVVIAPAVHETFSFTLSEALCSAVPVIASRLGSIEERLAAAELAECLVDSPAEAADLLLKIAGAPDLLEPLREKVKAFRHPTVGDSAGRLLEIYGAAGSALFRAGEPPDQERQERSFKAYLAGVEAAERERSAVVTVDHSRGPWWYRLGRRFEDVLPALVQRLLRRHFMRRHWEVLAEFTFSGQHPPQALSEDLELLGFRFGYPVFRSKGPRPHIALPLRTLDPRLVQIVRFRIKAVTDAIPCAGLFWVHGADEDFSEEKSILMPLERTRKWQDVIVDVQKWHGRDRWLAGPQIVRMRLHPLNCEGRFELDSLWLARAT